MERYEEVATMDRVYLCACGSTAWVDYDDDCVVISCANGHSVSAPTKREARWNWNELQRRLRGGSSTSTGSRRRG